MIEVTIHYPTCRQIFKPDEPLQPSSDKVRVEFVLPKRPFLFWSEHHIGEMLNLPKGYGVAWYDLLTDKVLMAPMPLNVLVGFAIWCYHWTRYGAVYWLGNRLPKHLRTIQRHGFRFWWKN